ncbi:MAG: hypothetical protein KY428_10035 [Bacteroidetes bacterium]|nr:hypothetical protein [Bacteroidota bacterium]
MKNTAEDYKNIKGWGIDADPKNDPTYPMKKRTNEEHKGYSWKRPTQQPIDIEVLHSNERPNVTAVFGTSAPPHGLSGMIRRQAFKSSEDGFGRWLPLLIADRVDVVEGIIDDLMHGHIPNYFAEKGMKAQLKHDPKGLFQNIAITAVLAAGVALLIARRR